VKDGFLNCLIDRDYKREGMFITGGIAHKKNYKYGKFEFRIRMDEDPHKSSSGLGLTWPESEKWPDDGENDIYETNHEDNAWNTYIHYAVSGKDQQYQQSFRNYSKTDWHIVAMEWAPEYIKIYIDGKLEWTLKDPVAMAKAPHHLCFQTEKDINKPFTKQLKLQVDWVKVYKYVPKK